MKNIKKLILLAVMLMFVFPEEIFAWRDLNPGTPQIKTICTYTAAVSGVGGDTFGKYYLYIQTFNNEIAFTIGYNTQEMGPVSVKQVYNEGAKLTSYRNVTGTSYNKDIEIKHIGPLLEAKGAPKAYDLSQIKVGMTCPAFAWIGADYLDYQIGVALYDQIIDSKYHSLCDGEGGNQVCYSNTYLKLIDEETSMSDKNDFNEKLQKFKDLIAELDELIDDNGEALNCKNFKDRYSDIYEELASLETALANYAKHDQTLTFDKEYGADIRSLARKAEIYCRSDDGNNSGNNGANYNPGDPQTGCEVIPVEIRKWINNILNFVRYVGLALVIALGALDFMKAAGSGESDAMKKAGQTFMKRMIAVVVLFLLPVIVDFILNMIDIYGVDKNNIDCL